MTTGTDIQATAPEDLGLFDAGPGRMLTVAAEVANQFADIVKRQRMSIRIGSSEHIQVEAWQTIGAMTGVFVDKDSARVEEIAWRHDPPPAGDEPARPGREPQTGPNSASWREWKAIADAYDAWQLRHDLREAWELGRAFGFTAELAVHRGPVTMGWAQGSVDRTEENWAPKADHELRSMAQTRAQSRALSMPLRWTVKMAGYDPTPADDGNVPAADAAPWGPVTSTDEDLEQAAKIVADLLAITLDDASQFVVAMGQKFDGVPVACLHMLRGLFRFRSDKRAAAGAAGPPPENVPPDPPGSAYHSIPDDVVYPPGRYQGD